MKKVQTSLDQQFRGIAEDAKGLNVIIDDNNEKLKSQFTQWQNEQETYMQTIHNEVLGLTDTKDLVKNLNEQITVLTQLQKKAKTT